MSSQITDAQVLRAQKVLAEVASTIAHKGLIDECAAVLGAAQVLAIVGADRRELMEPPKSEATPAAPGEEVTP